MNYSRHVRVLNPTKIPVVYTHYYQWLEAHALNKGNYAQALDYLIHVFGFVPTQDRVQGEDVQTLALIGQAYWDRRLRA